MVKTRVEHEYSIMSKLLKIEDNSVMSCTRPPRTKQFASIHFIQSTMVQMVPFRSYRLSSWCMHIRLLARSPTWAPSFSAASGSFYDIPHINPPGFLVMSMLNLDVVSSDSHDWRDCLNSPAFPANSHVLSLNNRYLLSIKLNSSLADIEEQNDTIEDPKQCKTRGDYQLNTYVPRKSCCPLKQLSFSYH